MDKLPNEIVLAICRYLCPHCYQAGQGTLELLRTTKILFASMGKSAQDKMSSLMFRQYLRDQAECQDALAQLCLVSRNISSIARPILYHCLSEGRGTYRRTTCFLSVIASRPDLAACVRSFCPVLCNFQQMRSSDPIYHYDPFKIPRDLGIACPVYPVNRSLDALLVGLAWCTERVEEMIINPHDLVLATPETDVDNHWDHLPRRGFPSLRSLELRADESMTFRYLRLGSPPSFFLFDQAPRLQVLKLYQVVGIHRDLAFMQNLRSVRLVDCLFGSISIKSLVARLPVVEEFEYRAAWPRQLDFRFEGVGLNVTPYHLGCQLYRRRRTLKRIIVDQSWRQKYAKEGEEEFSEREVLPSFVDFPVLEYLTVHVEDVIPRRKYEPSDQHYGEADDEEADMDSEDEGDTDEEDADEEVADWGPHMQPDRTEEGLRFVGLVPPTLKELTVLGPCSYSECLRLSNLKALGEVGPRLEKVVFGDIHGSPWDTLSGRTELKKHFKDEAGIECQILAEEDEDRYLDSDFLGEVEGE